MKWSLPGAVLASALVALPGPAAAEWLLGNNTEGGVATVFLSRSSTYAGGIAFVCDNRSALQPEYILVVTNPFDAVLGRLEVAVAIGAQPPTTTTWTAIPRDKLLRSRTVVVRDVLATLAAEPGIAFTTNDDFGRSYRVEAPVENIAELVPEFLAACGALPPPAAAPFGRF